MHLDFSIINVPICNLVPVKALSPVTVGLPDINTASVVNWTPINSYTTSNYTDFTPVESMNDSIVFEQTKAMLLNSTPLDADVIFIQFDDLDEAGHAYGFHPSII